MPFSRRHAERSTLCVVVVSTTHPVERCEHCAEIAYRLIMLNKAVEAAGRVGHDRDHFSTLGLHVGASMEEHRAVL